MATFREGEPIGHYRLVRRLGVGRFGEVWLANYKTKVVEQQRAVKLPLEQAVNLPSLQREAALWCACDHPNVVRFYDATVITGQPLLASEFCSEGSLEEFLARKNHQPLAWEEAVQLTCGILQGLEHLHEKGIIHRDLKPANVLLKGDEPRLCDFGISRMFTVSGETSVISGTRLYMCPEAYEGQYNQKTDLWSVGVILYRLVTGRYPFRDESAIKDPLRPPDDFLRALPALLEDVIRTALDKDPSCRYDSARKMLDDFQPLVRQHSTAQRDRAEKNYRDLVLDYTDSVELANLPERDRIVAAKQIELRHLYVSLRARVQPPTDELADPAAQTNERSIEECLADSPHLVVLGRPGAGKTTVLKWLATAYLLRLKANPSYNTRPEVRALPDKDWLPIIVRCRDLDNATLNGPLRLLLHYVLSLTEASSDEVAILQMLLYDRLEEGKAILLIDGLDEIVDPVVRARFCERLESIQRKHPNAPIIITSRVVGYHEMNYRLGPVFKHAVLADFTKKDKVEFVKRWCKEVEPPQKRPQAESSLISAIESSPRIEWLTGSPILLTTLALVIRRFEKLPRKRKELYQEAVQVLLLWKASQWDDVPDSDQAMPQLQYVSYAMCEQGVQQLPEDKVLDLLQRLRQEYPNLRPVARRSPEQFLRLLVARTGLLDRSGDVHRDGQRVRVYQFPHLTFQEYLACRALVDGHYPDRDRRRGLAEHLGELVGQLLKRSREPGSARDASLPDTWSEVIRLCVVCCHDDLVEPVLDAVRTPLPDETATADSCRARAILAAFCLAEEPNVSDEAAERILRQFVEQVGDRDGLGGVNKTQVDQAVVELSGSLFRPLLQRLLLGAYLAHDEDPEMRERLGVLYAVAAYQDVPRDPARLGDWWKIQAGDLASTDDAAVVGASLAVMEMAYTGRGRVLPDMISRLMARLDGPAPVAHAAAWALACLESQGEGGWRPDPAALAALTARLRQGGANPKVLVRLAGIVGRERFRPAIPALIALLGSQHPEVCQAAGGALVRVGEDAIEPLWQAMNAQSEDWQLRGWAIAVLERLDPNGSRAPRDRLLNDPKAEIRQRAFASVVRQAGDNTNLLLISEHFDGRAPWIDPGKEIDPGRIERATQALKLSSDDVRKRYEKLARQFRLRLVTS